MKEQMGGSGGERYHPPTIMDEATPITVLEGHPEFQHETTESQVMRTDEVSSGGDRPATLPERFSAFVTDLLIFFYLLLAWALVLKFFTHGEISSPFSFRGTLQILFLSVGSAIHFLYYLFFEGVLTATPGKILAGLAIRKKSGGIPSLFAVCLRNVFRIIDYPLILVTGIGLIEATSRRQRLGDLVAGTVVVREISSGGRRIDPEAAVPAGVTRRSLAFFLDLLLIVPFFYGLLLILPAKRTLVSMAGLNLVPFLTLLYLSASEYFFQTTFGKAVFGLRVISEDGTIPRFAMIMVRNGFRILDANPVGYSLAALSRLKQRPGDIAAGTMVVKNRQGVRGWLSVPFMIVLAVTVAFLGYRNPESFFRKGLRIQVAGHKFSPVPAALQRLAYRRLHIEGLEFGFTEKEVNRNAVYDRGDVIYLLAKISGYTIRNEKAWIQGDIRVRDAARNIVLDRTNIINASLPVAGRRSADLAARFALHSQATPGPYEVTFTLRDLFGNAKLIETKTFTVRP